MNRPAVSSLQARLYTTTRITFPLAPPRTSQPFSTSLKPPEQCFARRHFTSRRYPTRRPSLVPRHHAIKTSPWQQTVRRVHDGGSTLWQRLGALRQSNPVALPTALVAVFATCGAALAVTWVYITYFVPIDHTFPEPVAQKLKRALYYSSQDVQPTKAWDYYRQALQAAEEEGSKLHPFSDEVLGIKFSAAGMLERTNNFSQAITVLDVVRGDCLRFVDWCDAQTAGISLNPASPTGEKAGEELDNARNLRRARTRVLGKVVGTCVKLGELYSNQYVNDLPSAERVLSQGVELALKEHQRREQAHVRDEDEGQWLSAEELGGTLESLANHYESISKHSLASPLYLRAITLSPPSSCHTAILMNNLAASLSQTLPEQNTPIIINASTTTPSSSSPAIATPPPTSRAALISNARAWSERAISVCAAVKPAERTEECDIGCAVATHNLAEFAEMEGLVDEARRKYGEARALARSVGFTEGVRNAEECIRRLQDK